MCITFLSDAKKTYAATRFICQKLGKKPNFTDLHYFEKNYTYINDINLV